MREKRTLEIELRKRGTALAVDLGKFMTRPLIHRDLASLRRFVNDAMAQDYVRYLYVLDPDGTVVMHNDLAEVGKILGSAAGAPTNPWSSTHATLPAARNIAPLPLRSASRT